MEFGCQIKFWKFWIFGFGSSFVHISSISKIKTRFMLGFQPRIWILFPKCHYFTLEKLNFSTLRSPALFEASIMQNWKKLFSFHDCFPKGETNFECLVLNLHTLNYHTWHLQASWGKFPLQRSLDTWWGTFLMDTLSVHSRWQRSRRSTILT